MNRISALIRYTTKKRGLDAEQKAEDLLKYLLNAEKIKEIVPVAQCSFMDSILKTDKIVRRLDGVAVPIQIKASPSQGIAFTEFLTEYIDENWAYPLILIFLEQFGWEKHIDSTTKQINLWRGDFRYKDWQLEYSPYLDFSKFKIFGRSIQLRAKSFLEARADPAKAKEFEGLEAKRKNNILEERKKRADKRREKRAEKKEIGAYVKITSPIDSESWDYDLAEEEKIDQAFESLRQKEKIIYFVKARPYSWLALIWQTDVVVKCSDGFLAPISARKSRQVRENTIAKALIDFFENNYGSAPLLLDTENPDTDKINDWAGNFTYADWMIEDEGYFDPKQFKNWNFKHRIISFLNLKWLKYGIAEEILNVAGIKTRRDKNGILFLD